MLGLLAGILPGSLPAHPEGMRRAADDQQRDVVADDRRRGADLDSIDAQVGAEPVRHRVRDRLRVAEHRFVDHQRTHHWLLSRAAAQLS
jgi:hypothetical protein